MGKREEDQVRGQAEQGRQTAAQDYNMLHADTRQAGATESLNRTKSRTALDTTSRDLAATGGVSPEMQNRVRGLGVYDDFANTGGYTEADKGNIKARALAPVGALAESARQELERRRAVQGGYAPGFDAASNRLRRDAARGAVDASLNANLEVKDRVNANKFAGAQGLTTSELGLHGAKLQGQQLGLAGLGNVYQSDVDQYQAERDRTLGIVRDKTAADMGYLDLYSNADKDPGGGGGWQQYAMAGANVASAYYNSR